MHNLTCVTLWPRVVPNLPGQTNDEWYSEGIYPTHIFFYSAYKTSVNFRKTSDVINLFVKNALLQKTMIKTLKSFKSFYFIPL